MYKEIVMLLLFCITSCCAALDFKDQPLRAKNLNQEFFINVIKQALFPIQYPYLARFSPEKRADVAWIKQQTKLQKPHVQDKLYEMYPKDGTCVFLIDNGKVVSPQLYNDEVKRTWNARADKLKELFDKYGYQPNRVTLDMIKDFGCFGAFKILRQLKDSDSFEQLHEKPFYFDAIQKQQCGQSCKQVLEALLPVAEQFQQGKKIEPMGPIWFVHTQDAEPEALMYAADLRYFNKYNLNMKLSSFQTTFPNAVKFYSPTQFEMLACLHHECTHIARQHRHKLMENNNKFHYDPEVFMYYRRLNELEADNLSLLVKSQNDEDKYILDPVVCESALNYCESGLLDQPLSQNSPHPSRKTEYQNYKEFIACIRDHPQGATKDQALDCLHKKQPARIWYELMAQKNRIPEHKDL